MIMRMFVTGVCLLIGFHSITSADVPIRVGIYQNKPKVFTDSNGEAQGIFVDILEYIATKERWHIDYVPATWDQCLEGLTEGRIDLMVDVAVSEDRSLIYDFNDITILNNWAQIYVPEGSGIESVLDLNDRKIAVLKGDISYSEFSSTLDHFGINCEFVEVADFLNVFELVDGETVDARIRKCIFFIRLFGGKE